MSPHPPPVPPPTCPSARREERVETVHGLPVADPYRWLEDLDDAAGREWAEGQDALFAAERGNWPGLAAWGRRLTEATVHRRVAAPVWRGGRCYTERHLPGHDQAVLYVTEADGSERVVVDADTRAPRGRVRLAGWRPSWEGGLVACQFSTDGADTTRLEVYAADGGGPVGEPVERLRHASVTWLPGGMAFYYVGPAAGGPPGLLRVKLHRIGRPAAHDEEVFGEQVDGFAYLGLSIAPDGSQLAVSVTRGISARNDLWLADTPADDLARPRWRQTVDGEKTGALSAIRLHRGGGARLHTDRDAPRGRILVNDPTAADGWRELVPQDPRAALDDSVLLDGPGLPEPLLLVCWSLDATSRITVHRASDGVRTGEVPLPGTGSVRALRVRPEGGHQAWFTYTDFGTPPTVHVYDASTGHVTRWEEDRRGLPGPRAPHTTASGSAASASVPAAPSAASSAVREPTDGGPAPATSTAEARPELLTRQVRYEAGDGTPVLLFLLTRADQPLALPLDPPSAALTGAPRPTLLTGYGGFGTPMRPGYTPVARAWAEAGGVYAVACVRGGGEHGNAWHAAGRGAAKSRAVDDFNDAARHLIAQGITAPDRLAAAGQSNGGLLVTSALTRRPDLYAAVAATGPLCDMARYERFGLGPTWTAEYGSADDPAQLAGLLGYSPYHQVRPGTRYPAVLLSVADDDHRTGAQHVRKLCAALQHAHTGPAPILMRRTTTGGHGHASAQTAHELLTDVNAFLAHHAGLLAST